MIEEATEGITLRLSEEETLLLKRALNHFSWKIHELALEASQTPLAKLKRLGMTPEEWALEIAATLRDCAQCDAMLARLREANKQAALAAAEKNP